MRIVLLDKSSLLPEISLEGGKAQEVETPLAWATLWIAWYSYQRQAAPQEHIQIIWLDASQGGYITEAGQTYWVCGDQYLHYQLREQLDLNALAGQKSVRPAWHYALSPSQINSLRESIPLMKTVGLMGVNQFEWSTLLGDELIANGEKIQIISVGDFKNFDITYPSYIEHDLVKVNDKGQCLSHLWALLDLTQPELVDLCPASAPDRAVVKKFQAEFICHDAYYHGVVVFSRVKKLPILRCEQSLQACDVMLKKDGEYVLWQEAHMKFYCSYRYKSSNYHKQIKINKQGHCFLMEKDAESSEEELKTYESLHELVEAHPIELQKPAVLIDYFLFKKKASNQSTPTAVYVEDKPNFLQQVISVQNTEDMSIFLKGCQLYDQSIDRVDYNMYYGLYFDTSHKIVLRVHSTERSIDDIDEFPCIETRKGLLLGTFNQGIVINNLYIFDSILSRNQYYPLIELLKKKGLIIATYYTSIGQYEKSDKIKKIRRKFLSKENMDEHNRNKKNIEMSKFKSNDAKKEFMNLLRESQKELDHIYGRKYTVKKQYEFKRYHNRFMYGFYHEKIGPNRDDRRGSRNVIPNLQRAINDFLIDPDRNLAKLESAVNSALGQAEAYFRWQGRYEVKQLCFSLQIKINQLYEAYDELTMDEKS